MIQGDIAVVCQEAAPRRVSEPTVYGKWFWNTAFNRLHMPGKAKGPYDTKEAAVADAKDILTRQLPFSFHSANDEFYVGRAVPASIPFPMAPADIIDDLKDSFFPDDNGEFDPGDWLFNVKSEVQDSLSAALDKVLQQWMIDNDLLPPWLGMEEVVLIRCYET